MKKKSLADFRNLSIDKSQQKIINGGSLFLSHEAICNILSASLNLSMQNRDVAAITEFNMVRFDAGCI